MPFIDSHAHLTSDDFSDDEIETILQAASLAGVEKIVNICTDKKSLERAVHLKERFPQIYLTGSTTPHDVEKEGEAFFPIFEQAAKDGQLVAIGETGLDYYYEHSNRKVQLEFARRYFTLALENKLPIVIHCREAFADLISLIDQEFPQFGKTLPGILHCFTGTLEEAKSLLERGWYISLSGIVTFKKSVALQEVASYVPLDHLLIETDSPYLAPQSKRGKRNEPSYLPETGRFIAQLKGIDVQEVAKATWNNTQTAFSL
ncbi:MAG: TatD family hydrolase [Parachlamydiales bacterium]|nr:TatD family hydrolase [Parachlamydiales bacterium]